MERWSSSQSEAFQVQLAAMKGILFGNDSDGGFTAQAKAELAPALASGALLYVRCDAGSEEAAICSRAGIRQTPTLIAGGERAEGWGDGGLRRVSELVEAPLQVSAQLQARGAVLYGRDSCVWTRRQRAVLGAAPLLYVDCEEQGQGKGAEACAAAGISAVPTWELRGGKKLPGYRGLSALQQLASGSKQQAAGAGKGSGVC